MVGGSATALCGEPFLNTATTSRRGSTLTGADPTVELLRRHWADCTARLAVLSLRVTGRTRLFSAEPDIGRPREPASLISPRITVVDQLAPVKSTVD
jgi:hypothetical protein